MNKTATAPTRTDWRSAAILIAAGVVVCCLIGKVPPSLPDLRADIATSLREAGWYVSLLNLMTALSGMVFALTADRAGHRRLIVGGLVVGAAASVAGALSSSFAALLVCRALEGIGFLCVAVSVPPLLLRLAAPSDTRAMMAVWGAYLPAGAGLMALGSAFLLPWLGWRGVWGLAAAALLAMAAIVWGSDAGARNDTPSGVRSLRSEVAETVSAPGPLLIALCFAGYSASWFSLIGFLSTLQVEKLGFSVASAAAVTAGVILVNVVGSLVAGKLLKSGWSRFAVIGSTAAVMATTAVFVFADILPPVGRLAMAFVFSTAASAIPGALFAAIPVHAPRPSLAGATNGLLMQGSNLGILIGPPTVAVLVSAGGWSMAPWFTTPALALSALAGWLLQRREDARPPVREPG